MLSDYIDLYLANSRDSKTEGTYLGEVPIASSLKRCMASLDITSFEKLKYESYHEIVRYYKVFTRCKNASINKYIAYLKAILRHFGQITHPFLLTKKLPDDTTHTRTIKRSDLMKIMCYVTDHNKNKNSIVYRAAIYLLYETGCRISELLAIKIKNVNVVDRWILLEKTKNHKTRVVPYSHLGALVMSDLIRMNKQSSFLFWNQIKNRRLEYNDIKLYLRDMMEVLDINHVHPHMFRKTMATSLVEKGAKMKTVQTLLGHELMSTTEIYTEYSSKTAVKDYFKHDISQGVISAIENR